MFVGTGDGGGGGMMRVLDRVMMVVVEVETMVMEKKEVGVGWMRWLYR